MRTYIFLCVAISWGLLCISSAVDTNSTVHHVETHHFHLNTDPVEDNQDSESYSTGHPLGDHHKSSTPGHNKHKPQLFPNTEREISEFFHEATHDDDSAENHNMNHDSHVHHVQIGGDKMKMLASPNDKSLADEPRMGADHGGHVMDSDHDMHTMDNDHDHHKKMDKNETGMEHSMMMMKMYFHIGVKETVLFENWKITTVGGLVGSMIGIFLLAMIYEGLKYFREHLFKKYVSSIQFSTVAVTGESGKVTQVHKVERHRMMGLSHALQTLLHVVQLIMSYFLMLIFMTYNVWLCLAVVLGAGVGYFIFGWKKATVVDITEHCH